MSLGAVGLGLLDLVRGLFAFPASRPIPGRRASVAAEIEARYSRPRRCC